MQQAALILQNGQIFRGKGFGANGVTYAEVVFNTSMTGYTESLTDPSYAGQLLCFSFPLIGNYGSTLEWGESDRIFAAGAICSEIEDEPSHRSAKEFNPSLTTDDKEEVFGSLPDVLKKFNKGGISGIDTRALVKIIRNVGTMPAVLVVWEGEEPGYLKDRSGVIYNLQSPESNFGDTLNQTKTPKIKDFDPLEGVSSSEVFKKACEFATNKEEIGFLDWPSVVGTKEIKKYVWEENSDSRISFPGGRLVDYKTSKIKDFDPLEGNPQSSANFDPLEGVSSGEPVLPLKKVVIIDCGVKENIVREVARRGFETIVVPASTSFEKIMALNPNGILISNGPGDPRDYGYIVKTVQELINYSLKPENYLPIFGICLGNQLIGAAIGAEIYKMKFGNRGGNQPVIHHKTKKAFLTSQNHSYTVRASSLPAEWEVLFTNLNDQTVEGLIHKNGNIFSVQFHPEACGGPRDTNFLFDEFEGLIKKEG